MTCRVFRLLLLTVALVGSHRSAQAQINWNVAAGNYNTPGSWQGGVVPGAADIALINNGGTANYTAGSAALDQLIVGENAGQSGTFNLTGGDLAPNRAVFGEGGTATATLNGGFLNVGGGSLFVGGTQDGVNSGVGTLNVSGGPTTMFDSGDDVQFGRNGTGTLNMSGGWGAGGYTVVAKFGTATWNHSGGVFDQDFGDIEIGDGGTPEQVDIPGPRQGTINLTGGVIQGSGSVAIGNRSGGGLVKVTGGALAVTGDANGTGSIFVGRGMNWVDQGVGGATTLHIVGDDGIIVANGTLDMNTSGVASSSTLIAEITGATHTPIKVNGNAEIANGAFKVLLGGYTPVSGDSWTIIEAGADLTADLTAVDTIVAAGGYPALAHTQGVLGTLNGTFLSTDFSMAPLASGLSWGVSYANNKVTLNVTGTAQFAADFNDDGRVNAADLGIWRGAYSNTAAGDANGDGRSDGADFLIWQRQLGSGGPAVCAAGSVPEPSALAIAALGAAIVAGRRRKHRRDH